MGSSIRQQILKKAIAAVGEQEVAIHLKVPISLIQAWAEGQASMPDRKFVALTDLLDRLGRKR